MRAVIFGAGGQDGIYLSKLCKERGIEAIGISRHGNWIRGDVRNLKEVQRIVRQYLPDYIFDLAAKSSTAHDVLYENHETISTGTLNILESVYRFSPNTKVFLAGSGVQFKNFGVPISEESEFEANSPYSIARIQSVYAARYYRRLGIKVYVGYLFHHESPFRQEQHVSKMVSQAVNRISKGESKILKIGNMDVEREWMFAGDAIRAILTLVNQDDVYEAVIGTGVTHTIRDWIKLCFKLIGIDEWEKYVCVKQGFVPEYKSLVSDPSTIKSLGWKPTVDFEKLAKIMISKEEY